MLQAFLGDFHDISEAQFTTLAERTVGASGADLSELVDKVDNLSMGDVIKATQFFVDTEGVCEPYNREKHGETMERVKNMSIHDNEVDPSKIRRPPSPSTTLTNT